MSDTTAVEVPAPRTGRRAVIRTPDQRLRVFVSSTLAELADERQAVKRAVARLRLAPVMFEAGARPHPPRELYRAYLAQSHVFVGVYWQRYGWVAPDEDVSGLEDEYRLSGDRPKLMYVKAPAPEREPRLAALLERIKTDDRASYRPFGTAEELEELVADDLAVLLSEVFELGHAHEHEAPDDDHTSRIAPTPLPVPPTPLVGRERDVERIEALLSRPEVRVVTVSGSGGIGKSRVALEVAERALANGTTTAWAGLSDVTDPNLVAAAVLQSLGLREQPTSSAAECIKGAVGDSPVFVVLDGGERVLDAAANLATLLHTCRHARVLVTSRAVLAVRAEHEYPLGPLDVPPETARPTLATFELSGAGRLFLDVARASVPSWEPTDADAAALAEICRALDGVPLAIELAAARIKVFSPNALRDRLTNRLAVLTGGARDLPRRHQTLRATLDWDHDLLGPDEQALFRRLGVCSGGFTLELAETLARAAGNEPETDPLDVVASLVGKSLIRHAGSSAEPRFELLGVVREYALGRLDATDEGDVVRRAHAAFMVAFVEGAQPFGTEQVRWLDALEAERRNVLAALHHARDTGDGATVLRLCAATAPLWEMHGHLAEGAHWLGHALASTTGEINVARAEALAGAAHLARARLDFTVARELLEEALHINEELGDPRRRARNLKDLGIVAGEADDHDTARAYFRQAIVGFRSVGDRRGEAQSLNNLALSTEAAGDVRGSLAMYAEALPVLREIGDMLSVARLLNNVGGALRHVGAGELARTALLRALARYRRLASRWDLTDSLEHLAPAVLDAGDPALAARLLGAAEALREQLGAPAAPYLEQVRAADAAAVRAALGPAADAEWQAGRRLAWDDAAGAALAGAPPEIVDLDDPSVDIDLERRIAAAVATP
jgi:predicted ATPase